MIARYDLARWIPSFDCLSWLAIMAGLGATEVVVDARRMKDYKWPMAMCRQRVDSIVLQAPALFGMSAREGSDGEEFGVDPDLKTLVAHVRAGKPFARPRTVLPAGDARYTVTLRQTQRAKERNSNLTAWRAFADRIGAVVIQDYDEHPIGLHQRMALYAGARMNFFVVSGPSHLCMLAGLPCMVFDAQENAPSLTRSGVAAGQGFPWQVEGQQLIWEPDELPVIERYFAAWEPAHAA